MPERERRWTERVETWAQAQEIDRQSQETYATHLTVSRVFRAVGVQGNLQCAGGDAGGRSRVQVRGKGISRNQPWKAARHNDVGDGPLGLLREFSRVREGSARPRLETLPVSLGAGPARTYPTNGFEGRGRGGLERGTLGRSEGSIRPRSLWRAKTGRSESRNSRRRIAVFRWVVNRPSSKGQVVEAAPSKTPAARSELDNRRHGGERTERQGLSIRPVEQGRDLARACRTAGTRRDSPHDLRRTYASMMFEAGAPLEAVQDLMGHEDPQTTRHYQGPV